MSDTAVGPLSEVPCAWCGGKNDLRDLGIEPERGMSYACDHCKQENEVVVVDNRPRVLVKRRKP